MSESLSSSLVSPAPLVLVLQSDDATLAARHEAFGALVAAYQDMACGYALAQLGSWPAAEDAAQEAFIIAYQQIGQLRDPSAFGAWLRRIVWSLCRRAQSAPAEAPLPADEPGLAASGEPGPESSVEAANWREQVLAMVRALPGHERDAILLYYIDGYSQQEVATFLKITAPALRKRLQRAREHLREAMMELLRDSLEARRPSKDESFLRAVQFATTLEEAALEAQFAVLEAALLDGIDVNAADISGADVSGAGAGGQTLLHWAARHGHLDALLLLLRNDADPTLCDRLGRTPLRVALDAGQQQAAALLRRWADDHPARSVAEEQHR